MIVKEIIAEHRVCDVYKTRRGVRGVKVEVGYADGRGGFIKASKLLGDLSPRAFKRLLMILTRGMGRDPYAMVKCKAIASLTKEFRENLQEQTDQELPNVPEPQETEKGEDVE